MISSSNLIGIAQSVQSPGGDAARNSRLLQTRSLIARPSPGKLGKKSGETCRNVSARIARRCVSVEKIFGCNARNKQSERAGEGIGANDTACGSCRSDAASMAERQKEWSALCIWLGPACPACPNHSPFPFLAAHRHLNQVQTA